MFTEFGFPQRVILLVGLMLAIAGWDRYRKGAKATKFQEYGFILLTGAIGCGFGFFNDLITASISPGYFVYGKGLEPGDGLRLAAGFLGMQTGASAGIIGGAACLFFCRKKVNYKRLSCGLWMPVVSAVLTSLVLALLCTRFDPAGYAETLKDTVSPQELARFQTVWWAHTGLYLGYVVGLMGMIRKGGGGDGRDRKNGKDGGDSSGMASPV